MKRLLSLALFAALAASSVHANDWGNMAIISSTMGNHAGRLCVGEGLRVSDIGCPTYAPSISTAGHVSITGNVSANKFIGDGSLLTGVGQGDRIVSGTTNVIATQDRSVTISTAGTQRVVVGENGNIGIGTSTPNDLLTVYRAGTGGGGVTVLSNAGTQATLSANRSAGSVNPITQSGDSLLTFTAGTMNTGGLVIGPWSNQSGMRIDSVGRVGIGLASPTATLQVSGSLTISSTLTNTVPALYVDTYGRVGVGSIPVTTTLQVGAAPTYKPTAGSIASFYSASAHDKPVMIIEAGGNAADEEGLIVYGRGTSFSGDLVRFSGLRTTSAYNLLNLVAGEDASGAGGASRFMVRGDGNVGIGTQSPTATLQVSGSFIVSTSAQNTTPSLYVGTNGRVGFGTLTPAQKLEVATGTVSTSIRLSASKDSNVNIQPLAEVVAGFTSTAWADGYLGFNAPTATPYATAPARAMTILSSGNVGIGTATPDSSLTIVGEAQVGSSGAACVTATNAGAIRYTSGNLQYCNGSNTWTTLSAGGGTPAGSTGDISVTAV